MTYRLTLAALLLPACIQLQSLDVGGAPQNVVTDWRDEVVYQLLTDRFADGDTSNDYNIDLTNMESYHGGDWQGVIDELDYLQQLGVTAVWISPVVKNVESDSGNSSYHGYWAQDFTQVNPHFGTLAGLRALSDAVHARKMKLILDLVTNHVGQLFFYDINKNGEPDIIEEGTGTSSPVTRVTEYDPDYDPNGVQAETSLGLSGPAPIIFFQRAETSIAFRRCR